MIAQGLAGFKVSLFQGFSSCVQFDEAGTKLSVTITHIYGIERDKMYIIAKYKPCKKKEEEFPISFFFWREKS